MFSFETDATDLQSAFDEAVAGLRGNLRRATGHDAPVLFEGAEYAGYQPVARFTRRTFAPIPNPPPTITIYQRRTAAVQFAAEAP